jgi:hypothetical protein
VLMRLPYDQELAIHYAQGMPAVGVLPEYQQKFSQLYQDINKLAR